MCFQKYLLQSLKAHLCSLPVPMPHQLAHNAWGASVVYLREGNTYTARKTNILGVQRYDKNISIYSNIYIYIYIYKYIYI